MIRFPWRHRPLDVWYHPSMRIPLTDLPTGMDPRRADNVLTWLLDRRITTGPHVQEAPEARWSDLRRVHADPWLASLDDAAVVASVLGLPSDRVPVASILELWRRGVGAAVEAARHARAHGCRTATLLGGFHHAWPDRGTGFCALNDIATAIAVLRAEGFRGRVLVVDLDAHPPDGLVAFDLPDTEIRSLGVASEWTTDAAIDVRVPVGTRDTAYLHALDGLLARPKADFFFYIAGSDPLAGDPLGQLGVSEAGLRERDRRVFAALGDLPGVVVPGGGYTRRSWPIFAHTLAEAAGSRQSVPDHYDPVTRRMGRVARTFPALADEPLFTEADMEALMGRPTERRFLGTFTRHGVELALDRYGLLGALRRLGFADLSLEVTTGESPERLRVFGMQAGRRHRLVDLTLAIDRLEGHGVLRVDWLELADPRTSGALPGQRHRGLGVAREIGSILAVTAERMGLDGVMFVPSHYHVAWIARNRATFADPLVRGRFRAIRELFEDVPLHRLSQVLDGPGLPTEDGDVLTWQPSPMVHALDPGLKALLQAGRSEARSVADGTKLRLLEPSVTFG